MHCEYSDWELSIDFFHESTWWQWSYDDLASLSRTSHALRAFAQPLLYHTFVSRHAGSFLRTLFKRPDLANSVKIFRGFGNGYNVGQILNESLAQEYTGRVDEAQCLIDVGRALGLGGDELTVEYIFGLDAEGLKERQDNVDYDALVHFHRERYDKLITSCLFAMCPNLQFACVRESSSTIELERAYPLSYQFMDMRLKSMGAIGRHGSTFSSLETLVVEWPYRHNNRSLGLERLRVILEAAPNLQRLVLIGGRGKYDSSFSSMQPIAEIANLRELRLCAFRCSAELTVPYAAIAKAAERCPRLETFELQALSYLSPWTTPNPFSPAKLLQSLLPARQSLTNLTISSSHILMTPNRDNIAIGPILREFSSLKTLRLDEQCFCAHWINRNEGGEYGTTYKGCLTEIIPGWVQTLTIVLHDRFRAIQDIVALGTHAVRSSSCLVTLRIVFFEDRAQTEDYSLQSNRDYCLPDCFYCDTSCENHASQLLGPLVEEAEQLISAAFQDTDIDVSVKRSYENKMVNHILVIPQKAP